MMLWCLACEIIHCMWNEGWYHLLRHKVSHCAFHSKSASKTWKNTGLLWLHAKRSSVYWMNSLFVCKRWKKLYQKYLLKWVFSAKDFFRKIFFHCLQYYCWKNIFLKKIISEKSFFIASSTTVAKSFFLKNIISEKSFFIACKGFLHFWLWWNLNYKASACFCMLLHASACFCMLLHVFARFCTLLNAFALHAKSELSSGQFSKSIDDFGWLCIAMHISLMEVSERSKTSKEPRILF